METIIEAKSFLKDNYKKGCECPACGHFVKMYKRKLNSGMALTLLRIYKHSRGWIKVKEWLRINKYKNNHDWTLLFYWGLLEEGDNRATKGGKTNGEWRITEKGIEFAQNKIIVSKYIYIYNNRFLGFDPDSTNIIDSLGNHFDYNELMSQLF